VNDLRARQLVADERIRVEALLAGSASDIHADGPLQRQQTGEFRDGGSELNSEMVSLALAADLRVQLAAVARAEERIAHGDYGRSIESGTRIPDDRLEVEPLAERTVEEQSEYESHGSPTQ
jgi:RNA polymerase-binding transcription factor DksA